MLYTKFCGDRSARSGDAHTFDGVDKKYHNCLLIESKGMILQNDNYAKQKNPSNCRATVVLKFKRHHCTKQLPQSK